MNLPKRNSAAGSHLDAIRGICALVVLAEHLRNLILTDWPESTQRSPIAKPLYFVTGLGQQAVLIFFVLSGFFISSSVFNGLAKKRWSAIGYAQARLTRLYVVLIPALLLGFALDWIGTTYFSWSAAYQPGYGHEIGLVRETLTPFVLFTNAFFVQTILVPPLGTNAVLWSLANEFWYYVAFPLFLFAIRTPRISHKAALLVAGSAVLIFIGPDKRLGFGIWLLGTAVAVLPVTRISKNVVFRRAAWVAFLAFIVASRLFPNRINYDFPIAIVFAILIWALASEESEAHPRYRRISEFLSGFSYTLYLVHVPFLVLMTAIVIGKGPRLQPTLLNIGLMSGLGLLAVCFALVVWSLTERHTEDVRHWLAARMVWAKKP